MEGAIHADDEGIGLDRVPATAEEVSDDEVEDNEVDEEEEVETEEEMEDMAEEDLQLVSGVNDIDSDASAADCEDEEDDDVYAGMPPCRQCGSKRVKSLFVQSRSADEGMTNMFVCQRRGCGNTWQGAR